MTISLAKKMSVLRASKGLSQNELASLAKVPQSAISEIESGKRKNPGVNTMNAIAKVLGITVNDFINETKEAKQ